MSSPTIILLHGLPGAGKSTLRGLLLQGLPDCIVFSCGDMIRAEIEACSDYGSAWKAVIQRGDLIPDEQITDYVFAKWSTLPLQAWMLIDGFPRTPAQASAFRRFLFERGLGIDAVLHLVLSVDTARERVRARRTCPTCGAIYNIQSYPPSVEGICDRDGSALTTRPDQFGELLEARMANYLRAYQELLIYYETSDIRHLRLDALAPMREVAIQAAALLLPLRISKLKTET